MITLNGKYNTAKVFTDNVEETAIGQIIELLNQEFIKDSQVRIMPDTHAGAGCTVGTTMTVHDKIVPNLVGVDIGCGMFCVNLGNMELNLQEIDKFIRTNIPNGFNTYSHPVKNFRKIQDLFCINDLKNRDFNSAIGTLGGGNHFIEIDVAHNGDKILVIHSGSRNLGLQVAKYYQNKAIEYHHGLDNGFEKAKKELIGIYRKSGKGKEIPNAIKDLEKNHKKVSKIQDDLCYLEGDLMKAYLHDLKIAQEYAMKNRETMAEKIIGFIGDDIKYFSQFHTVHNYIDLDKMVLRKGAVSAQKGETLIIPINMKDGSLICEGKGNADWNFSAPHGAGRLMSRSKAKENLSMKTFSESMKGIYTTSVGLSTLDEAPMAYKPIDEIIENVQDSVEILDIIKPIYNFKSGGND